MSHELYVKAAGTFCLVDSLEYLAGTLCASGFFFVIFLKTKCITKQSFSVCGIRDIQGCLRLISSSATLNIFQEWTGHIILWAWIKVLKEAVKKCPSTSPTDGIGNSYWSRASLDKDLYIKKVWSYCSIGHFWVASSLCFKVRLSARPLIWKWFFIFMQIKLIFTRKVPHLAFFFWKWGFLELRCGLFPEGSWGGGGGGVGKGQIEDMQRTILCNKTWPPTGSLGYWYMLQNHSTSLCHLF